MSASEARQCRTNTVARQQQRTRHAQKFKLSALLDAPDAEHIPGAAADDNFPVKVEEDRNLMFQGFARERTNHLAVVEVVCIVPFHGVESDKKRAMCRQTCAYPDSCFEH